MSFLGVWWAEDRGTETLALYSLRKYRHLKVSFPEYRARHRPTSRCSTSSECTLPQIPQHLHLNYSDIRIRVAEKTFMPRILLLSHLLDFIPFFAFESSTNCRLDISRRPDYVSTTHSHTSRNDQLFSLLLPLGKDWDFFLENELRNISGVLD